MGILRRLRGGGSKSVDVRLNVTTFDMLRDDAAIEAVGEAYRQAAVASVRPPGPSDLPPGLPPPPAGYFKAMLIPEPTNQYDPNAIKVVLWAGERGSIAATCPALTRRTFSPCSATSLLALPRLRTGARPRQPSSRAMPTESVRGAAWGIVLHLGSPAECVVELAIDKRMPTPDHSWVGKTVAFTGQLGSTVAGVPIDRYGQLMLARWAGCEVVPRLTKKTGALIVADPQDLTGNLQRAKEYGVPVVVETDFLLGIGIAPELVGHVSGRWAHG